MQFRVVVPEGCLPGQVLRLRVVADGTEANARIPTGLVPGDSFVVEVATKAADADADATGGGESPNLADRKKQRQQAKKQKQQSQSQSKLQSGPTNTAEDGQNPLPAVVVSGDHSEDAVVVVLPQEQATTTPAKAPSGGARPEAHPSAGAAIRPRFRRPASREFLLALAAGALALGASAALGFVLGVVHVTEPLFRVFPLEKPKQRSMAVPQRGQKRVLKATIKGIKLSQKGTTLTIAGSEG